MWKRYQVEVEFTTNFGASLPRTPDGIRAMLEHRMPSEAAFKKIENPVPVAVLAEQVIQEVEASEEEPPGWATFPHDAQGIYVEPRTVRGHIKDCALQVAATTGITAFKAKVANKVYVVEEPLRLRRADSALITKVDGTITRTIQVMTRQGPRSSLKRVDYVAPPSRLAFVLRVWDDKVVGEKELRTIFEYGEVHGMGAERSQHWGNYHLLKLEAMSPRSVVG